MKHNHESYELKNEGRSPRLVYTFNHRAVEIPARQRNEEAVAVQVDLLDGNAIHIRRLQLNGGALKIEGMTDEANAILDRATEPLPKTAHSNSRVRVNGQPRKEIPRPVRDGVMEDVEQTQQQSQSQPQTTETGGAAVPQEGQGGDEGETLAGVGEPDAPARPRSRRNGRR